MKKRSLSIIMGIIMMLTFVITCTGCGITEKPSITADTFVSTMEAKGYEIVDAKDQFPDEDSIQKVFIAISPEKNYQIEFYDMVDIDAATILYNKNQQLFESSRGNVSGSTSAEIGNYSKYTLTTNGKYKAVSRIDNTVIYLNVPESVKETVAEVLKEIGY